MLTDFGKHSIDASGEDVWAIAGPLLGMISASYNLGAIFAVPVVPWVAQKVGRRWSIFIGSVFQCVGAVIQGFSQHGQSHPVVEKAYLLITLQLACILLLA